MRECLLAAAVVLVEADLDLDDVYHLLVQIGYESRAPLLPPKMEMEI